MHEQPTNVIDLARALRRASLMRKAVAKVVEAKSAPRLPATKDDTDVEQRWSEHFKTKPSWRIGHPFVGVTEIEHDIRNAEDWAWLTRQIHQLRAAYEARVGRALPEEDTLAWCADADDELEL